MPCLDSNLRLGPYEVAPFGYERGFDQCDHRLGIQGRQTIDREIAIDKSFRNTGSHDGLTCGTIRIDYVGNERSSRLTVFVVNDLEFVSSCLIDTS